MHGATSRINIRQHYSGLTLHVSAFEISMYIYSQLLKSTQTNHSLRPRPGVRMYMYMHRRKPTVSRR